MMEMEMFRTRQWANRPSQKAASCRDRVRFFPLFFQSVNSLIKNRKKPAMPVIIIIANRLSPSFCPITALPLLA